jgi:hypothetical protein
MIYTKWTSEMVEKLTNEFSNRLTRNIANDLGLSIDVVKRKAAYLGLKKEAGFLENNREEINKLAVKFKSPHPMKGVKGWSVPNGEKTQFKKGNIPPQVKNTDLKKVFTDRRNETIKKERLRIKYGMEQKTNLRLVNIY